MSEKYMNTDKTFKMMGEKVINLGGFVHEQEHVKPGPQKGYPGGRNRPW
jgi:hypothetical protein